MTGGIPQRIPTPDILKGVAVILMVQVHIMELLARQAIFDGPAGWASLFLGGAPAAPVFMIVMGYFLAFRQKSPGVMILRGARLFLAGMLLNIGLNAHLIYKVVFEGWGASVDIWPYIFGADILHLAGLGLVIIGILAPMLKKSVILWTALVVLLFAIPAFISPYDGSNISALYISAFFFSQAHWSYFPVLPWLAYPVAGYVYFLVEQRYGGTLANLKYRLGLAGILTVFLSFTAQYATGIMHDLPAYYHHDACFFLWVIAFVTWWSVIASLAEYFTGNTRVLKYIKWLGRHVTTAYVFQWLIIGNVATAVYKTLSLQACAFLFVLILIFTSLLTQAWNRVSNRFAINFLSF